MDGDAVRKSRTSRRRPGAGGSAGAASAVRADLLSIMHWVDDLVADCVVRSGLPGRDRDRVIDLATDIRAACRRLAADPALGAAPPPFLCGNALRFPRPGAGSRRGGGLRSRRRPGVGAGQ